MLNGADCIGKANRIGFTLIQWWESLQFVGNFAAKYASKLGYRRSVIANTILFSQTKLRLERRSKQPLKLLFTWSL
mgnify:CR=1 FL=1